MTPARRKPPRLRLFHSHSSSPSPVSYLRHTTPTPLPPYSPSFFSKSQEQAEPAGPIRRPSFASPSFRSPLASRVRSPLAINQMSLWLQNLLKQKKFWHLLLQSI
ncbi:uncharacterized protein LOC110115093 isoform X2 [Dendrobium catenatum]|uniref:uncharacterized protein LOC110115093 isoform X2 n=1 Tax=Dendrobium catenatum TaxID=906689 RepID=UPI0009F2030F|nr:uncharacterized protein LOC110115093 isoform X2 [Dendrobium catenatum]